MRTGYLSLEDIYIDDGLKNPLGNKVLEQQNHWEFRIISSDPFSACSEYHENAWCIQKVYDKGESVAPPDWVPSAMKLYTR